jgi:hypothetical protein
MVSILAERIKQRLDNTEISLEPEKRGKAKLPGVPDSVVWVRPSDLPVGWCIPVLFELENKGQFSDAYRDIEQFAKRHSPKETAEEENYKYTVSWPTTSPSSRAKITMQVDYEMVGMSTSTLVTGERDVSEGEFHRRLCEYYRLNDTAIETAGVETRSYDSTEVVLWSLEVRLTNGDTIDNIILPFITSFGEEFERVFRERLPSLKLPVGVYIGGEGTDRAAEITRETGVEFEYMRIRKKGQSH